MGYTAVRGGLSAIEHAEALAADKPRGVDALGLRQISGHLALALARVMAEGGVCDQELASLALKQAEGDTLEAAFLLRAYRSTLPRVGYSLTVSGREMVVNRRISSVYRDIPGGQVLGLTRDYSRRLLDFALAHTETAPIPAANGTTSLSGGGLLPNGLTADRHGWLSYGEGVTGAGGAAGAVGGADGEADADDSRDFPLVIDVLREEGLLGPAPTAADTGEPVDITREPPRFPMPRSGVLQTLARGEAGAMLMLAYSSMRGYGGTGHGAIAELRGGELPVRIAHPLTGRPVTLGHIEVSETHYISGGHASKQEPDQADYRLGYGLSLGRDERRAISMAVIDSSLRNASPNDKSPVADQEFVVYHIDSVEASGFVEHLKLPHYVTFQAGVQRSRRFRELLEASRA